MEAVASVALAVGGVVPYLPQYLELARQGASRSEMYTKDNDGFAPLICFVLLVANMARIFFWLLERFDVTLLIQSVLMIVAQLALLHRYVANTHGRLSRARAGGIGFGGGGGRRVSVWDLEPESFWKWNAFGDYLYFLAGVASLLGALTYGFRNTHPYSVALGYLSLLCEATLALPQIKRNADRQSTMGLSNGMVAGWVIGDAFKTGYFYWRESPSQFKLCGVTQLCLDAVLLVQLWMYRDSTGMSEEERDRQSALEATTELAPVEENDREV